MASAVVPVFSRPVVPKPPAPKKPVDLKKLIPPKKKEELVLCQKDVIDVENPVWGFIPVAFIVTGAVLWHGPTSAIVWGSVAALSLLHRAGKYCNTNDGFKPVIGFTGLRFVGLLVAVAVTATVDTAIIGGLLWPIAIAAINFGNGTLYKRITTN